MESPLKPSLIPYFKKQSFLEQMSEDDFRDRIVRPFYILQGLEHGKDLCGPDEDGKDCYFFAKDVIRERILIAIQTKRGDLKMSKDAKDNVISAVTQLRTALNTPVKNAVTKQSFRPDCVLLVASGEINKKAEDFITDEVKDPRIAFLDSARIIPKIDALMPEVWLGIDVKTLPYLRALREDLIRQSDTIDASQLGVGEGIASPITDETYVQLYLHRYNPQLEKMGGRRNKELFEQLPVQEVLKKREKLILMTGEAGAGKTTSLRRLALLLVQQALQSKDSAPIPVFLRATEVVRQGGRLVDVAALTAEKISSESSHCFSLTELQEGNVAVLIDGYDELASSAKREILVEQIRAFHSQFPLCRIILTSRDYSYARALPEKLPFIRYNISPINLQQTQRIVERLSKGKSLKPDVANEMLRRLDSIHGMDLNPLLVTVFVATSDYSRQDIPANITELFKKFTEMMLGRWDSSKGIAQQYHAPLKDFLLCRIAFQIHQARTTSWPLDKCREVIRQELEDRGHEADVEALFEEIVNRSGLLVAMDEDVRFRHLLLQEFFAGRGIPDAEFLHSVVDDPWWTKAVVFYFGQNPDNHQDLRAVIQSLEGATSWRLYQAAISVGLALQACYLTKVADKVVILRWVVDSLTATRDEIGSGKKEDGQNETVMEFITYFVFGRDAVAAKVIRSVSDQILAEPISNPMTPEEETRRFWCIAGLIEAGEMSMAEELIKHFHPKDTRLLLCLHMGCFYAWKLHISSAEQKKIAERICDKLAPKVAHLHAQVRKEVRSILIEVQSGQMKAIDEECEEGPEKGTS